MATEKTYVKLAKQIEDLFEEENSTYGDIVAALALVNLWNAAEYTQLCCEDVD